MRAFDRDLVRGEHYGQRSREPHYQAEHMAAPTTAARVKKALANPEPSTHANPEPSTHGPKPEWPALFGRIRNWGDSGHAGQTVGTAALEPAARASSRLHEPCAKREC